MTDTDDMAAQDRLFWERARTAGQPDEASSEAPQASVEALGQPLDALLAYRLHSGDPAYIPPSNLTARMATLLRQVRPDLVAQERPSLVDQAVTVLRRMTASLIVDTATLPQGIAGLRSAAEGRTRQVAFVSEAADLDLELTMGSSPDLPHAVTGQLGMAVVPPNQTIWFVPAGQVPATGEIRPSDIDDAIEAAVNEDGYFRLTISSGDWVGLVEIGDAVVLFREIRV